MKRSLIIFALLLLGGPEARAQTVRIGVFGLFHPHEMKLEVPAGKAIILRADRRSFVLERSSGQRFARFRSRGDALLVQVGDETIRAREITAANRAGEQVEFVLAVPGKIRREYRGTLELKSFHGVLVPVVFMDIETAVASAIQAESGPQTSLEALKAQAIVSRSYMIAARGRHGDLFDFCDTTHCQYLREPPARGSHADIATRSTKGLVLSYEGEPFPAMFTRSCSGRTRTPEEDGYQTRGYPYYSVACDYCRAHPHRWESRVSPKDAELIARQSEAARLEIGRREGWDAVPSDDFSMHEVGDAVLLEGSGEGHGIGLCQRGARAMSDSGSDFRQILEHYFPNTTIINETDDEPTHSGLQSGK